MICFIADSAKVNIKIDNRTKKLLVGCASHKLKLEFNRMTQNMTALSSVIISVHDNTNTVNSRLERSTIVRNLTDLRPVLNNETR